MSIGLAWLVSMGRRWYARPVFFLSETIKHCNTGRLYRLGRWLEGARSVKASDYPGTCGSYSALGANVDFSGACPVQGDGEIDGRQIYYRSRGEGWALWIASKPNIDPLDDPDAWVYSENPYYWPDGGRISAKESISNIGKALKIYRGEP